MLRQSLVALILSLGLVCGFAQAADPTLHQVYQAAEAGRYREAQSMMDQVLKDHPNSAKAHFVEAELLARQGLTKEAQTELSTAERLEPGLPFAKSESVAALRQRLGTAVAGTIPVTAAAASTASASLPGQAGSVPWGLILGGLAFIVIVSLLFNRNRRPAPWAMPAPTPAPAAPGNGWGNNQWGAPAAPGYGSVPQAPSGGMGSGLLGSLATGAAVGAGVVAGEALMHRMLDGGGSHRDSLSSLQNVQPDNLQIPAPFADAGNSDMGGQDFGISDSSSWDDSSSGSSDDWS